MLKKAFLLASLLSVATIGSAQTTFLQLRTENYHTLDRLETMSGRLSDELCLQSKGESRRSAIKFLINTPTTYFDSVWEYQRVNKRGGYKPNELGRRLSDIDNYNIEQMISESGEWTPSENGAKPSKHPILKSLYATQYNLGYIKTENFFMVVNPVFNGTVTRQNNTPAFDPIAKAAVPENLFYSSRGVEVRGWIAKKVGFYTMFTDNQERLPYHVQYNANKYYEAVPGADYFKKPTSTFGTYDYLQASGYVNFDAVKNHLNVTLGHGKHFIGDGISSLFLTDNSSNMPYLKLRARIWKLNYDVLYLELTPQYVKAKDRSIGHKYSTMHYLTANVTPWLNLGLFEAQVFNRPNRFEFSYMNPIILTTAISRYNGAGDKSLIGLSGKAVIAHHVQLYGQFVLNEFRIGELVSSRKWYGNKWGVLLGAKYFNAFEIDNLDLQGEMEAVRPYTYSAQDTIANYTNYNQPLADPLGSGFVKATGVIKYQPLRKLFLMARATVYMRGNDTGSMNLGNDIFKPYTSVPPQYQYGVQMINGPKSMCRMLNVSASYQVRPNVFVDLGGVYRKYANEAGAYPHSNTAGVFYNEAVTSYIYFGVRINAQRRDYDFF
ncbi:MAG: hypothetical protein V4649_09990 [Bacteroidota bacterium]